MPRLQTHQDVRILRADKARIAICRVDAAERQPDVIEDAFHLRRGDLPAYRIFHQVANARRLLNARSGFRADVQPELPAVGGWEEIAAEPWNQQESAAANRKKRRDEENAAIDHGGKQQLVADPEAFEDALERALEQREGIPRSS